MYKHGVYTSEIPTSIVPPVEALVGLPVVIGTAPINLASDPKTNEPVLCYTYAEAVQYLGYINDFENYTLCEFMKSHFTLFSVAPVVFINVLDKTKHKATIAEAAISIVNNEAIIKVQGVILDTLVVKNASSEAVPDIDYDAGFNDAGECVITILNKSISGEIKVSYDKIDSSLVTSADVIGGVSSEGISTGLELINQVLPKFGIVPGQLVAPKYSCDPSVAAVMSSKAGNINGFFKCISLVDIPVSEAGKYSDVVEWKNSNNYIYENQIALWPKVRLGDDIYHMSTQVAGLICKTDSQNNGVPYVSPSNHSLQMNGLVGNNNDEVVIGIDQANYLNGQGVVTAINFSGGWKLWGNRTACYPSVTDPKDSFIPVKRMFYYIAQTIIQSFWQKVDAPITVRLIDTIVDSLNIWLNGMTSAGYILGGRVVFLESENPLTSIMDGKIKFHVYVTPPSPAREISFDLEYDVDYLKTLFS